MNSYIIGSRKMASYFTKGWHKMSDRMGNIRRAIQKRIDAMTEQTAVDLLSTRNNRYGSFDYMAEYTDSWLDTEARWDEIEYAEVAAEHKLGLREQIKMTHNSDTDEVSIGTVALRHTKRFAYVTTDEDGEAIVRQAHL